MNQSKTSDSAGCADAHGAPRLTSQVAGPFFSKRHLAMKKFQPSARAWSRSFGKLFDVVHSSVARTASLRSSASLRNLLFAAACVAFGFCLGTHWQSSGDATFGRLPLVAAAPVSAPQSTLAVATHSPRLPADSNSGWSNAERAEVFGSLPAADRNGTGSVDRQGLVVVISDSTASL